MAMAWLWTGMVAVSLIFGALTGNLNALSAAALEGAQSAVELCLTMCGVMCLWTGVMEVMNQCHLTDFPLPPAAQEAPAEREPRQ